MLPYEDDLAVFVASLTAPRCPEVSQKFPSLCRLRGVISGRWRFILVFYAFQAYVADSSDSFFVFEGSARVSLEKADIFGVRYREKHIL